jgi:outer membrane lipoprotein-sorting protein
LGVALTACACLLCGISARGQAAPPQKPQMAEEVFKNIQVLRGIPIDEFMGTMGFFSASLGLNCTGCHGEESNSSLAAYASDTPLKQTARKMVLMMNALNKASFGGKHEVTCYSCHRGDLRPKSTPSLAQQYGAPPPDDPNDIEASEDAPKGPSADQILDKYLLAIGGAAQLSKFTSFIGNGTYEGYDTFHHKVPVYVYAKAPSQRTTVVHSSSGDSTTVFDGRSGWIAAADQLTRVVAMSGGDLTGAKLDAALSFPVQIKQVLAEWRSDFPETSIDDRDVQVIEGTSDGRTPVKLFFDKQSGLLVRQLRFNDTAVGLNPTQIDYSDYREVSGVKVPFHWTVTWTDGQSMIELSDVQANVPIDAAKFGKPAPPPREATP